MLIIRLTQEMQYIHKLLCLKSKVEKIEFREIPVIPVISISIYVDFNPNMYFAGIYDRVVGFFLFSIYHTLEIM